LKGAVGGLPEGLRVMLGPGKKKKKLGSERKKMDSGALKDAS